MANPYVMVTRASDGGQRVTSFSTKIAAKKAGAAARAAGANSSIYSRKAYEQFIKPPGRNAGSPSASSSSKS